MAIPTNTSAGRANGALAQGGAIEPVVYSAQPAIDTLLSGFHHEFPRPATRFNRLITWLGNRMPQQDLTPAKLRDWLSSSLEVFSGFVDDVSALERIREETAWIVSDDLPPDPDVWSGECKFANGRMPLVICYRKTLASRLPGAANEVAWQGSMDHFVGHLYPFFRGATDPSEYDENVACRYQHLAAQQRARKDRRFAVVARLMPLTYRFHKDIPLANFRP